MTQFKWKAKPIDPKELSYTEGYWVCRTCEKPADTEHGKKECRRCRDWNGCGKDCTLSKLICKNCNISEKI